jgi:hypothetical protein
MRRGPSSSFEWGLDWPLVIAFGLLLALITYDYR